MIGKGRTTKAKHKDGHLFPVHLSISESTQNGIKQFMATVMPLGEESSDAASAVTANFGVLDQMLDAAVAINEKGIIQYYNKVGLSFSRFVVDFELKICTKYA